MLRGRPGRRMAPIAGGSATCGDPRPKLALGCAECSGGKTELSRDLPKSGDPGNEIPGIGEDGVNLALHALEPVVLYLPVIEQGADLIHNLAFDSCLEPELTLLNYSETRLDAIEAHAQSCLPLFDTVEACFEPTLTLLNVPEAGLDFAESQIQPDLALRERL